MDHGVALPTDPAERDFVEELRAWLDENLVGEFVGQPDRGGPDNGRSREF